MKKYSNCSVNPPRRIYRILKFGARSGGFTERRISRTDFEISETLLLRLITQRNQLSRSTKSIKTNPLLSHAPSLPPSSSHLHSTSPGIRSPENGAEFPERYLIFKWRRIYRTADLPNTFLKFQNAPAADLPNNYCTITEPSRLEKSRTHAKSIII